jgi:hypothetical protein
MKRRVEISPEDSAHRCTTTPEAETVETSICTAGKEPIMEEFLGSISNSTAKSYKRGIALFVELYGKPIDAILEKRKADLTTEAGETMLNAKQRSIRYEKLLEKYHA